MFSLRNKKKLSLNYSQYPLLSEALIIMHFAFGKCNFCCSSCNLVVWLFIHVPISLSIHTFYYVWSVLSMFFCFFSDSKVKVKVKVSHSLIAVGAVGVRVPLYLGHSWWKAEPIPLLSLPYPSLIRKRYPFSAGLTERVFQSPHGAAERRTHAIRLLSAP